MAWFAVSALQRAAEGAVGSVMSLRHGVTSSFRGLGGRGMKKRFDALKGDFGDDFRRALYENKEFWGDWQGKFNRAGVLGKSYLGAEAVARVGLSGLDLGVAAASDAFRLGIGAAATAGGIAARVGFMGTVALPWTVAKGAYRANRAMGNPIGRGLGAAGRTAGNLAVHGTIGLGRDAVRAGAGVAGAIWHTRKNPVVGTLLAGGAVSGGLAYGQSKAQLRSSLGMVSGATPSYMLGSEAAFPGQAGYSSVKPDSQIDTFGASGDLVFALNNLRGGGVL